MPEPVVLPVNLPDRVKGSVKLSPGDRRSRGNSVQVVITVGDRLTGKGGYPADHSLQRGDVVPDARGVDKRLTRRREQVKRGVELNQVPAIPALMVPMPDLLFIPVTASHPRVGGQAVKGAPDADAAVVGTGLPADTDEHAVGVARPEPVLAEAAAGDVRVGVEHGQNGPPDRPVMEQPDHAVVELVEPVTPALPLLFLHAHQVTLAHAPADPLAINFGRSRARCYFLAMSQQACIFCERGRPLVTITKEHLISRWVDLVLTPELLGPDQSFERTATRPNGASTSRTWPTEIVAVIEAPLVCGGSTDGCNNGWMSELDGQVRHLLEPMMLGNPRTLAPEEQQTIATWAAMKSMILEYVWGTERVVILPQESRTFVFHQQRPPANMQIRIAAVESQGRPVAVFRRVYRLLPGTPGSASLPGFASCSTFALGCFVVQTFGASNTIPAAPLAPHGCTYFVINPPTGSAVTWPPPQALDDGGLDQFAHPLQPVLETFAGPQSTGSS